jgi:hypothetical protein
MRNNIPMAYDGKPMDLENMRSLGVRSVVAYCACGRERSANVDALPASVTVPSLASRFRCTSCGSRPWGVKPDWREHRAPGMGVKNLDDTKIFPQ